MRESGQPKMDKTQAENTCHTWNVYVALPVFLAALFLCIVPHTLHWCWIVPVKKLQIDKYPSDAIFDDIINDTVHILNRIDIKLQGLK